MAHLTEEMLATYEGASISDICWYGYTRADFNHCAHFVSHVLQLRTLRIGCGNVGHIVKKDQRVEGDGVTIRVNEIYNTIRCRSWSPKKKKYEHTSAQNRSGGLALDSSMKVWVSPALVYVTVKANILANNTMGTMPSKHIGIALNSSIWHYSNTKDQVVRWTLADFYNKFSKVYKADPVFYFSPIPPDTAPVPLPSPCVPSEVIEAIIENEMAKGDMS